MYKEIFRFCALQKRWRARSAEFSIHSSCEAAAAAAVDDDGDDGDDDDDDVDDDGVVASDTLVELSATFKLIRAASNDRDCAAGHSINLDGRHNGLCK